MPARWAVGCISAQRCESNSLREKCRLRSHHAKAESRLIQNAAHEAAQLAGGTLCFLNQRSVGFGNVFHQILKHQVQRVQRLTQIMAGGGNEPDLAKLSAAAFAFPTGAASDSKKRTMVVFQQVHPHHADNIGSGQNTD